MGLKSWIGEAFRGKAASTMPDPTPKQIKRVGYEFGAAAVSTNATNAVAFGQERQQLLTQLYQAYQTCVWVSAPIDLIARTVTAGGLRLVSDADDPEDLTPDPPQVLRLRRLMKFCNPDGDLVQLLYRAVIDLHLFGDAYFEIVSLLGEPVALYTLDSTTMTVLADAHGEVSGYIQNLDGLGGSRTATFKPGQVIHISLGAPRGGLYGVGPASKALLPVTAWLYASATIKETFRRGDPPRLHVDLAHTSDPDVQRWREQYQVFNMGPKAVGTPVLTTNGGQVQVLDTRKVPDYIAAKDHLRDDIVASSGVPPAKLGIIETGNLGGDSGEEQDKTFRINIVAPAQSLILEKINYLLVQMGFGISGWHLEFDEVDYRDSKIVEEIRDTRIRNGTYSLNRARGEIGEPPTPGGEVPVLIDRQNVIQWVDMDAASKAGIAQKLRGTSLEPTEPTVGEPVVLQKLDPATAPPAAPPDTAPGKPPKEDAARDIRLLGEAWQRTYRDRRRQALAEMPELIDA